MGAALGSSVRQAANLLLPNLPLQPGAYALVGMGAFFAGMLRCPIAAVLIVVEVTGDYALVLPLMLAVSLGIAISRRVSPQNLVERQLLEEGGRPDAGGSDPLGGMRVADVMASELITVGAGMTLVEAVRQIAGTRHHDYPVTDDHGVLLGIVDSDSIDVAARDEAPDTKIFRLVRTPAIVATADMLVTELVRSMGNNATTRCPVTAADGSGRLVGFVSPRDLLRARIRVLDDA
jgi:CIC family chloride channel protein